MEQVKREALEERRVKLEEDVPEARDVLAILERAELELNSARRIKGTNDHLAKALRPGLVHLKLPEALAQSFSLAPQILAIFSPFNEIHLRVIEEAEHELKANRRLDRSVVLCFSTDDRAVDRAAPSLPPDRKYLFVTFAEARAATDPKRWIRELLRSAFASARLFAPGQVGTGWDFMGRESELLELGRVVLGEGRPAGVFGLRRMGKTSLLRHWANSLLDIEDDALPEATLLVMDLNAIGFSERDPAGFFRLLLKTIQRWCDNVPAAHKELAGPRWWKVDANDRALSPLALQQMGEEALDDLLRFSKMHERRLVLVLDEYEQMLEADGISQGHVILSWIRGLYQQNARQFCFIVAGLDPAWLRRPRVQGRQNPLLGIVKDLPLSALSRKSLGELVHRIGRRAQLDFDHEAVDLVYAESGGHPFLARQICDLVDKGIPFAERQPALVGATNVQAVLPRFDRETNELMPEFLKAAKDIAGVSPEQLTTIAAGSDTSGMDSIALEDLESYGILARDPDGRWVHRIGGLGRWLVANYDVPVAAAGGAR